MKGLFSKKPHVTALSLLFSGLAVFQQAAVLGYAKNDQMETLAKLFALPGKERESCEHLIGATKANVGAYGHAPESFIDFFTKTVGNAFASYQDPDTLKRLDKEQVRLGDVLELIDTWFLAILVYLGWSPVAQSLVRPLLVVELQVSIDPSSGLGDSLVSF